MLNMIKGVQNHEDLGVGKKVAGQVDIPRVENRGGIKHDHLKRKAKGKTSIW